MPWGKLVSLTQLPSAEKAAQYGVTAKFNSKFPTSEDLYTIAQLIATVPSVQRLIPSSL
ncbi:hypothetical protein ABGV40_29690 [Paenibacillus amylolyticus]|uniref:hypothetical protein n=1 Tax=Paenibacillus amylolyticus TaxID=1451 RepID=UPI001F115D82|nr:hypothetical protein [Paenibacillus amylolyticus]